MAIRKIKLPGEQEPRDIGANSSNIIYDGDQGVTTTLNSKIQSIFTAIGDINSFEIALVNALPTENIDDHTIYFVPNSQDANTRDEYMYVGNQWEMIGSTTIDLSDYPTYDDITVTQGLTTGIPAATITVGSTTTTIYSEDGSKWNNVTLSKTGANVAANSYIPQLESSTSTSAQLATATSTPTNYSIAKYDRSAMLHSATPTISDKSNKVATTSFVIDAITTTVTPVAALTTGITIGSIDISGTTTTFYAPAENSDIFVLTTNDQGGFPWTTDKTWGETLEAVRSNKTVILNADGLSWPYLGQDDFDVTFYFGNQYRTYGIPSLDDFVQVTSNNAHVFRITYSLDISGPTITLQPSNSSVAASTITLPIYDGTII